MKRKHKYLIAIVLLALLPLKLAYSEVGPQIKDFLCGCDYCETVDTGFPLDISSHMTRCHSWSKGMQKTMELMRQLEKSQVEIHAYESRGIEESFSRENLPDELDPYKNYAWKETALYGWAYAQSNQANLNTDQWMHLKDFGWVWLIANTRNLTYSYDHGWLYTILHQNCRVLYWYNRGTWILPKNFTEKK